MSLKPSKRLQRPAALLVEVGEGNYEKDEDFVLSRNRPNLSGGETPLGARVTEP